MAFGVDTRSAYDDLFALYVPIAGVVFLIVAIVLLAVAWRFRARPGRVASQRATAPRLEIAYAIGLAVVATVLLWRSFDAISATSNPDATRAAAETRSGSDALTISIRASRWNWRLLYPGEVVQTGDGHARPATLVVPAAMPVHFTMTSLDVVHALWIPALAAKYDAMPGYVNAFDLRFASGLDYSTARCSEFCGVYHDQMRLRIDVRAPRDFSAWLRGRQRRESRT